MVITSHVVKGLASLLKRAHKVLGAQVSLFGNKGFGSGQASFRAELRLLPDSGCTAVASCSQAEIQATTESAWDWSCGGGGRKGQACSRPPVPPPGAGILLEGLLSSLAWFIVGKGGRGGRG